MNPECLPLMQSLVAGEQGISDIEQVKGLFLKCPEVCHAIWGTKDFELAGPGVVTATWMQTALFIVFGLLQAIVSYLMPPNPKSSTRLLLARLQAVFDTVYRTSVVFSIAIIATSAVRLRQGIRAYEASVMNDMLDIQLALHCLALIIVTIRIEPKDIKLNPQRWGWPTIWAVCQTALIVLYYMKGVTRKSNPALVGNFCSKIVRDLPTLPSTSVTEGAASAIQTASSAASYPHAMDSSAPGALMYLLMLIGVIVAAVLCEIFGDRFLPAGLYDKIKAFFNSRIVMAILTSIWALACVLSLAINQWHLLYMLQSMDVLDFRAYARWDFGQIAALSIWIPVLWQCLLTALTYVKLPTFGKSLGWSIPAVVFEVLVALLYDASVGKGAELHKEDEDEDGENKKSDDNTKASPAKTTDEKQVLPQVEPSRYPLDEKATLRESEEGRPMLKRSNSG